MLQYNFRYYNNTKVCSFCVQKQAGPVFYFSRSILLQRQDDPVSAFPFSLAAVRLQNLPDPIVDLRHFSLEIRSGNPESVVAQNDHLLQPVRCGDAHMIFLFFHLISRTFDEGIRSLCFSGEHHCDAPLLPVCSVPPLTRYASNTTMVSHCRNP